MSPSPIEDETRHLRQTIENLKARLQEATGEGNPTPWQLAAEATEQGMVQQECFWSTHRFVKGMNHAYSTSRVFYIPLGQVGQGFGEVLGIQETNIRDGGHFAPYGLLAKNVMVEIIGGTPEDKARARLSTVLRFDFIQTLVDIAPLGLFHWDETDRKGVFVFADEEAKHQGVLLPSHTSAGVTLSMGGQLSDVCTFDEDVSIRVTLGCVKAIEAHKGVSANVMPSPGLDFPSVMPGYLSST